MRKLPGLRRLSTTTSAYVLIAPAIAPQESVWSVPLRTSCTVRSAPHVASYLPQKERRWVCLRFNTNLMSDGEKAPCSKGNEQDADLRNWLWQSIGLYQRALT